MHCLLLPRFREEEIEQLRVSAGEDEDGMEALRTRQAETGPAGTAVIIVGLGQATRKAPTLPFSSSNPISPRRDGLAGD